MLEHCSLEYMRATAAQAAGIKATARPITIRFDANVRDLPWTFTPNQVSQEVRIGDTGLAFYKVTNNGRTPITAALNERNITSSGTMMAPPPMPRRPAKRPTTAPIAAASIAATN